VLPDSCSILTAEIPRNHDRPKEGMDTHLLSPQPTPSEYLAVTSLTDNIFLIGLLDRGVTIFNQQIRALNLIWALDHDGRLRSAQDIAVVGGGIAGLTAAMALRKIFALTDSSRRRITLFEKRSVLCPLQRGCATRWVHPHIYDWPKPISTNPSAGLPIMNWRAGRASDVAAWVVTQWEDEPADDAVKLEQWRNLRYLKIHHKSHEVEWVGEQYSDAAPPRVRGDKRQFDIIILAIGFGDERRSLRHGGDSYWRNETLGQPDLTDRQQRYVVSGTGDGGLIDLLRLRIADFREDRIGHQLAPEDSKEYKEIQRLRDKYYDPPSAQGTQLFDQARELGQELGLIEHIKKRLRADTMASLQIRSGRRVSDAFYGKSSFANRFLVSLLFDAGGFSPLFGDVETENTDGYEVIIRHGTNTRDHLTSVFSEDISVPLADLERKRDQKSFIEQPAEHWETGWPFDRETGSGFGSPKRDYVPEATIAVSSAFVSALAPVFSARGGDYRATLHRIITTQAATEEVHLQQIAQYHGPRAKPESSVKVVGRLFKIGDGVIGLAARTGRVLTTRHSDRPIDECRELLRVDMKLLGGEKWDPRRMDNEVSSLLACPLIYTSANGDDSVEARKVVAVLFADSTKVGAFDEDTVAKIVTACKEFGKYLHSIVQSKPHELFSVKSQATYNLADDSAGGDFGRFSLLTGSPTPPPRIPVEYINLDWWT
jgi:hypothetical protein